MNSKKGKEKESKEDTQKQRSKHANQKLKNKQTNIQTPRIHKQKHTIHIISLVEYLGWVFQIQKKNRPLVIITIPIPQSTPNIQIHPLQNNIHVSKFHCESALEPGVSGLCYYCTSICVHSWCTWRASSCIPNQKKKPPLWSVLPTSRGSAWVCQKLGNAPVLQSGTGSWVLSG